jgi:hypothetical protein
VQATAPRARSGHHGEVDDTPETGPGPAAPEDLRAGDTDRERVADALRMAHAEGRLDLTEFDERVAAAWQARTYRELRELTADLPGNLPGAAPPAPAAPRTRAVEMRPEHCAPAEREMRSSVQGWAGVSAITLVIWGISCLATGEFQYPWWLWVAGPWGVVLLLNWLHVGRQRH